MLGEFARNGRRLLYVLAGGGDLGDDSPLLGLPRVESLAAQHQITGAARTGNPGDPGDPAGGRQDADPDLGEPENCCGVGDPNVSGERQFETAAQAVSGDRGDGRLPEPGNTSYTEPDAR